MGLLDTLLGRSKPGRPNLDRMFALPPAAVTLDADLGLRSSGGAAVCFKPATGSPFATVESDLSALLDVDSHGGTSGGSLEWSTTTDRYGYQWVVLRGDDLEGVVTHAHMVNSSLETAGYGSQLLCSTFAFDGAPGRLYLVYLYKRGTFYPFAPRQSDRRDNELELKVRSVLGTELTIEEDLARWFPLWGLPL